MNKETIVEIYEGKLVNLYSELENRASQLSRHLDGVAKNIEENGTSTLISRCGEVQREGDVIDDLCKQITECKQTLEYLKSL